ncbi:ornithine carbamoyltransferase [Microterricola viridarii]|uniref:Ornithine carbamoyltransferase n=1 Tax=Microterricola viridarii TaxID=412690 RepID=A0A1H1N4P9_9MICO|nr:hypothetical protein [Microterricola viridarii]SDR93942.1 ornithine carbamoyltransferase [Microterricola viridarii]
MPHFLDLLTVTRAELDAVLARSAEWAAGSAEPRGPRVRIATVFAGPAFRTRLAFDTAIDLIGGHRVDLPIALGEREPICDTAAILSGGVDAVVVRHGDDAEVRELAAHSGVPVVSAMTALGHPCEVVSEAFTLRQRRGSLDGLALTFVGADTNLFRSWCELSTRYAITVTQLAPAGFAAPDAYLDGIRARGGAVATSTELEAACSGAEVLYCDGWPAAALEPGGIRDAFQALQVTSAVLELTAAGGVLMHCMPVARGNEVSADAFADPRSITLAAKANLAPSHAAILEHALGRL